MSRPRQKLCRPLLDDEITGVWFGAQRLEHNREAEARYAFQDPLKVPYGEDMQVFDTACCFPIKRMGLFCSTRSAAFGVLFNWNVG